MITNAVASNIERPASFVDFTQDWSRSCYVRYPSDSTGSDYYVSWFVTDDASDNYIELYAWLAGGVGVFSLTLDVKIATVLHAEVLSFPITSTDDIYATIQYTASTHTLDMYVNGVLADSAVLNLSALPTLDNDFMLDDGSGLATSVVGYDAVYQRILLSAEMIAQMSSITILSATSLLSYCPLQCSIDLTAHNNTLTQFFANGTITTDTDDPLLSIIAAPPTNTSPATALDLTTDSAQIWDTLSGGFADTVWGKYTAVAGDKVIGLCGFAGTSNHYRVQTRVYDGLANANGGTLYLNIGTSATAPVQFPVTVGNTYYFRFLAVGGGVTAPAILEVSVLKGLDLPAPVGSIAINDDVDGFPLALLDANTGYPLRFILDFPASEGAAVITTGNVLTADEGDADFKLFSYNFQTILATIAVSDVDDGSKVSENPSNQFLISTRAVNTTLRLVSSSGVLDPTIFNLASLSDGWGIGLNLDASLAYHSDSGFNEPIRVWNLLTNTAAANLVAGIGADYANGKDILVLGNGAIIVPYTSDTNDKIIAYNAAGAVQHTYDFGVFTGFHNGQDDRVFRAIDDPNSFWAWIRYENGISRFFNIVYLTGAYLSEIVAIQYENGIYQGALTDTFVRFGHSESCPAWITRVAVGVIAAANSGLYTVSGTGAIEAAKVIAGEGTGTALIRHDQNWIDTSLGTSENVKIPDPYYDTFLAGDE